MSDEDIYSKDYVSDPVAARAAQEAVAATEPHRRQHPFIGGLMVALGVFILLVGMVGLILSAINAVNLSHQNDKLAKEQKCVTQLIVNFERDQSARNQIAADDRKAVDNLVEAITEAKSPKQVERALANYKAQRKENDERRAQFPINDHASQACLTDEQKKNLGISVGPNNATGTATGSASASKKTTKPGSKTTPVAPKQSSGTRPSNSRSNGPVSHPQPGTTTTTKVVVGPGHTQTRTVVVPPPPKTSSSVGLLPIPGCTVNVLGIRICG